MEHPQCSLADLSAPELRSYLRRALVLLEPLAEEGISFEGHNEEPTDVLADLFMRLGLDENDDPWRAFAEGEGLARIERESTWGKALDNDIIAALGDCLARQEAAEKASAKAHAEIDLLRERLEITHCIDHEGKRVPHPTGKPGHLDGIDCRDETIRGLDRRVARYRAALNEIAMVRYGLEMGATTEESSEYWHGLAMLYRKAAHEALNGEGAR